MDERRFISLLAVVVIGYSVWQSQNDTGIPQATTHVAESRPAVVDSSTADEPPAGFEVVLVGDSAVLVESATGDTWILKEPLGAWVPLERHSADEAESLTDPNEPSSSDRDASAK